MLGLKAALPYAQEVKQYLVRHGLFDKRYGLVREQDAVIFPVAREFTPPFDFDVEFVQMDADERERGQSLRDALASVLTPEEQAQARAAYDMVGSIAIIDIPPGLEVREQLVGQKILELNKNIKTVLKKVGGHTGTFRTQRMACIAGEDTRLTTVVENGVRLKVDVEETYYSIRMSTERRRILDQIRPGEHILCLFSGVGPYPVTFSVHSQAERIVGVEINPKAHELALENAAKNRCTNVRLLCGDAHEVIRRLAANGERFDRVTMPLPHTAHEFLPSVLSVSRPGTVIHYYTFLPEGDFNKAIPLLRQALARAGYALERYDVVRAGQHAPRIWRICVDAVVGRN